MTTNVRIAFAVLGLLVGSGMATFASAEQDSSQSGTAKGGVHEGKGSGTQERQQPDTPPQAGSQGQQGMKGQGSPMEKDKGGDKMIDDKGKAKEKKK